MLNAPSYASVMKRIQDTIGERAPAGEMLVVGLVFGWYEMLLPHVDTIAACHTPSVGNIDVFWAGCCAYGDDDDGRELGNDIDGTKWRYDYDAFHELRCSIQEPADFVMDRGLHVVFMTAWPDETAKEGIRWEAPADLRVDFSNAPSGDTVDAVGDFLWNVVRAAEDHGQGQALVDSLQTEIRGMLGGQSEEATADESVTLIFKDRRVDFETGPPVTLKNESLSFLAAIYLRKDSEENSGALPYGNMITVQGDDGPLEISAKSLRDSLVRDFEAVGRDDEDVKLLVKSHRGRGRSGYRLALGLTVTDPISTGEAPWVQVSPEVAEAKQFSRERGDLRKNHRHLEDE